MQTSSLHNLVVGTPIISATYEQLQKSYFLPLKRLLKDSKCYLSTTSGPLAGLLSISSDKVAFCSERSMKVVIPLNKIKCVNKVTIDNFDFWFKGVLKYLETLKYLEQTILLSLAEW
ncbi:hypothetical protein PHAVU_007G013700 [Phaseolus vulgaris]|uniref:GRAM domain-containing protein n=1 Tax=Phaseolus vulgaris TaxID=3885 RepID=V7BE50_PHAVU|nr:hypothetical protein PHAVU_007G013700g [Phaseolus vulgaris]ESW14741.1 hypothetical protein PHAVU_007G013700g [Phaseolus vulgaris]